MREEAYRVKQAQLEVTFRDAIVVIVSVLASFGVTYALCTRIGAGASPAVLAAALSLGLARRAEPLNVRALLVRCVLLPIVAIAAGLIGFTLHTLPALGAVLFTAGIVASIWLRRYGDRGKAIGRTIALPFVAMLIVPVHIEVPGGPGAVTLSVIVAGIAAFVCSAAVTEIARRLGFSTRSSTPHVVARPKREETEATMPVSTRMSLQMLVALALAFTSGMLILPQHWSWVVLTAFLLCVDTVGRGDAIYKGLLRFAGAVGGTLTAALIPLLHISNGIADAAVVFVALFIGVWLRPINYAFWAACATLIFALLQPPHPDNDALLFAMRLEGIVIGALCGIAATWFVFPIRTESVVRRRVADALFAVRDLVTGHEPGTPEHPHKSAILDHHAAELERVAPPVRLHRFVLGAKQRDDHPATLIDAAHALLAKARSGETPRADLGAEMRKLGALLKRNSAPPAE